MLISRGSLEEVSYQMLLSKDLGYIDKKDYEIFTGQAAEVGKLLNGVMKSLAVVE